MPKYAYRDLRNNRQLNSQYYCGCVPQRYIDVDYVDCDSLRRLIWLAGTLLAIFSVSFIGLFDNFCFY